jgi:hypothetical protein
MGLPVFDGRVGEPESTVENAISPESANRAIRTGALKAIFMQFTAVPAHASILWIELFATLGAELRDAAEGLVCGVALHSH